jgi:hypothetical protein
MHHKTALAILTAAGLGTAGVHHHHSKYAGFRPPKVPTTGLIVRHHSKSKQRKRRTEMKCSQISSVAQSVS